MGTNYERLSDREKVEVNERNWYANAQRLKQSVENLDFDEALDAWNLSDVLLDCHLDIARELGGIATGETAKII